MSKYSQRYIEENATNCADCGKRIWRYNAVLADGIITCSSVCAESVLGNNAEFDRLNNTPEKIAQRLAIKVGA